MNDDTPCQKCDLYTNPEWILLCDHCDLGYHTECLTPRLYLVPDGDWYCPKCENDQLLTKLRFEFENYVSNLAKREREQLRKERLKYVEINIDNILTEESTSRKSKANKKKYEDYVSDLDDDSELDDDLDDGDTSVDYNSDDSDARDRRKCSSASRRRNNGGAYGRRRPAVQQRKVSRPPQKRKRRRSYTDESGSNSSLNSSLSSQEDDGDSNSSASSLPKQRSARKKVSYQFKEYDDLIDSAIRASDYEDEYAENDEELEDEEEEDSDNGKSPYSKGKDISNLMSMAAENPFKSDNDEEETEKKADEQPLVKADAAAVEPEPQSKEKPNDEQDAGEEDERKVVVPEQKGKQRSKRKLNDLDSPVEEAENDSDFTIKDESLTELEEDTEMDEVDSSDLSDATEDDTDLSDWARNTRKRSTRSGGRRHKSKRSKKRRRYDSSDESDYGYKTRRTAKRVTYKEMSTTEDDDLDDDYSDNSEKADKKKKKDGKKKKKVSTDDEFSDGPTGSEDERTVLKKSKRTQKKKKYEDYVSDLDESEEELQQPEEEQEANAVDPEAGEETKEQAIPASEVSNEPAEALPKVEVTQVQLPNADATQPSETTAPAKKASKVKIKITKPNPKLAKNKNLNSTEQPPSLNSLDVSDAQSTGPPNSSDLSAISQSENSTIDPNLSSDAPAKKKRNRAPKKPKEAVNDSSTPVAAPEQAPAPAKRSRKSKSSTNKEPVDMNAANLVPPTPAALNSLNNSSVLSQLTQFANDAKLDQVNNKLLPNPPFAGALDPANFKQFLNSAVPNAQQLNDLTMKHQLPFPSALLNHSQSEIIARQATLTANSKPDKSKCVAS